MTAEVTAIGTCRTFREIQRYAVGGAPPLRGERKSFVGRQAPDRGARQYHEADGLLPRAELTEASHPASVAGLTSATIIIFSSCGAFRCGVVVAWNVQRGTCNAVYSHSIVAGGLELTS